ncbi:hypothetical protein AB0425_38340 [Actinosynnema sp. NPDC051121]
MRARRVAAIAAGALLGIAGAVVSTSPASAATGWVSMQAACDDQYPGQGRVAKIRTWNVYGWRCVTGVVPVADGDIDVSRQCRTQYHSPSAYSAYRNYSDPYSWYCTF